MILGIDEVGRGPWAGPLVVGAVVLGGAQIEGLTDSKKLTKKRREELDPIIREHAVGYGLGWVHADELDEIGLAEALRLATRRAVEQVAVPYHEIIIDGTINFLADTSKGQYVKTMPKADLLVPSVSAASIIAKVAHDNFMCEQDAIYPEYKFKSHVGYGTAVHRAAIDTYGVTPLHRLSIAPLAKYATQTPDLKGKLAGKFDRMITLVSGRNGFAPGLIRPHAPDQSLAADVPTQKESQSPSTLVTNKATGDLAESEAANYLVRHGHTILERNWKTKYCEIDIVSQKDEIVYFTEVKYRKQPNQGGGIAAITKKKLNQMGFAAKMYVHANKINDTDLKLAVITVTGTPPDIEDFLELE